MAEADLDDSLKSKVNAAAQGNHSHSNKTVLDGITAEKVAGWDGKGTVYVQAAQPGRPGGGRPVDSDAGIGGTHGDL